MSVLPKTNAISIKIPLAIFTEVEKTLLKFIWNHSQSSRSVVSNSFQPHEPQHARPPCPSPTPRVHPNPCPLSWWCLPTISPSVIPFSCLQSLPASGSFPMSQLFTWDGQSIRVSASASVLPMHGCNQFLHRFWSPRKWNVTLFIFSSYICSFKCSASVSRQKCVSGVMDKLPNF